MKKVRFMSPVKRKRMEDSECHSPRPFMGRLDTNADFTHGYPKPLVYSSDPVLRFENSDSLPYPKINKTSLNRETQWRPSNDLDLSMLDSANHAPKKPTVINKTILLENRNISNTLSILSPLENKKAHGLDNGSVSTNNFFIRREEFNNNVDSNENVAPLQNHLRSLNLSKDKVMYGKQEDIERLSLESVRPAVRMQTKPNHAFPDCGKPIQSVSCNERNCLPTHSSLNPLASHTPNTVNDSECPYASHPVCNYHQCTCKPLPLPCSCQTKEIPLTDNNGGVDKRNWMLEKYGKDKRNSNLEVEKQNNIKDKREPTVADLFKIIKLQNEQLQLLQEKVDKFISVNSNKSPQYNQPLQNLTEQGVSKDHHKMSIGVMTSFEMVTTSTVINKEIVTQRTDNAQIQCNRSQISIKEVVSKSQPASLNFLDGITPASDRNNKPHTINSFNEYTNISQGVMTQPEGVNDDKTLNELSLYNIQVDNATTPHISPEPSLYLDVRDYSDSGSDIDDQSNVGWTYYNKVMSHVNGILQDSDMPSSASALYRNTRQHCVQMQIDKTNVSVTKRVKFGDDPRGFQQPHINVASSDTSLKMNQLAAKYLKNGVVSPRLPAPINNPALLPVDMSYATRNYMERHKIVQGASVPSHPPAAEMPRFLDITALKQQTKLL